MSGAYLKRALLGLMIFGVFGLFACSGVAVAGMAVVACEYRFRAG